MDLSRITASFLEQLWVELRRTKANTPKEGRKMKALLGSNEEEVILIKFAEKESPKQMFGSSMISSINNEDQMHRQQYHYYPSSTQEQSKEALNEESNIDQAEYGGSILFSINYLVATSIVVYLAYILFPRRFRNRFQQLQNKGDKRYSSSNKEKEYTKRTWFTTKNEKKRRNNANWISYCSQRKQNNALFPIQDKSLFDDSCSLQSMEEGDDESSKMEKHSLRLRKEHLDTSKRTSHDHHSSSKRDPKREVISPASKLVLSEKNYGSSLSALDTSFVSTCSLEKAGSRDNEELSPLGEF